MNASPASRLALLFGVIYFVQGIGEPTEGLIAQPTRSLLRSWGLGADDIAAFMLILGLPWYLKPVLGLFSDYLPILGSRRRNYLLLATLMTALGLAVAGLLDLAARYCPAASASTVFALLMALSNLSLSLASRVGAGCTAACWLLVRLLPRDEPDADANSSG